MCPECVREEVEDLVRRGVRVKLTEVNGQCYALTECLETLSPPWGAPQYDILIAIPAMYDAAELDGFYLGLPYTYNGGEHPRVQGQVIEVLERKWRQVSWHYPDGKPWCRGQDSLETHIVHCRGFFFHRGALNDR
jgi:hypothetical protein